MQKAMIIERGLRGWSECNEIKVIKYNLISVEALYCAPSMCMVFGRSQRTGLREAADSGFFTTLSNQIVPQ